MVLLNRLGLKIKGLSLLAVCGVFLIGLFPSWAFADSEQMYGHRYPQVWSAAIRLLRVDLRFPIREKDEEIGFLLFEYWEGKRRYAGSLEFVQMNPNGTKRVRAVAKIPGLPSYKEQLVLEKLGRKLLSEYGDPPRATPPPPKGSPSKPKDKEGTGSKKRR